MTHEWCSSEDMKSSFLDFMNVTHKWCNAEEMKGSFIDFITFLFYLHKEIYMYLIMLLLFDATLMDVLG